EDQAWLQQRLNHYKAEVPERLNGFVLPRGTPPIPQLHLARSACKKAIRVMVRVDQEGKEVPMLLPRMCNMLCNFFFVLTLVINQRRGLVEPEFISRSYGKNVCLPITSTQRDAGASRCNQPSARGTQLTRRSHHIGQRLSGFPPSAGFQAAVGVDPQGELAAVVFTQGCPWRCLYCHNPELLPARGDTEIPWQQIVDFMHSRRGLLDALVFSGGEPTFQSALPQAIEQIRAMGFKIGLHSAGIDPRKLQALLPLIDWIGLDIKASKNDYPLITQTRDSGIAAWQSAELVINSGVSHQLRI